MNEQNIQLINEMLTEGERLAAREWSWFVNDEKDSRVTEHMKNSLAILAQNQYVSRGLVNPKEEHNLGLNEDTNTGNIYGVNQILLPVLRRVFYKLMAHNFVAIQPMLSPVSLIFYMRYFYSNNKSGTAAGTEFLKVPLSGTYGLNPYYSHSKNVLSESTWTAVKAAAEGATQGFPNFTPSNSSVFVRAYGSGEVLLQEVQFQGVYGSATTITATNSRMYSDAGLGTITYNSSTKSFGGSHSPVAGTTRYEVEWMYNQEKAGDAGSANGIPELEARMETDAVQAIERKLKTQWTFEASEDFKTLHNIDAERELVNLMASEIMGEIDREIIKELIDYAAHRDYHDWTDDAGNNTLGNVIDRNQALAMRIAQMSAKIHAATRINGANFLLTSPFLAAKLSEVRGYVAASTGNNVKNSYGIQAGGFLPDSEIQVFKDPLFPKNLILVGYKGQTFLDSGFFYCPYIPIKVTPVIYDPNTLQPRRGMVTRYGTKMVDGGEYFYGTIVVTNLN